MSANTSTAPADACDFCHAPLAEPHQHLIAPSTRKLDCVCDACAILFSADGQTKRRRVPRRIRYLPEFRLSELQWNSLGIPIGVAFIFRSSGEDAITAIYPSPSGPIESLPPLESWEDIVKENPLLESMQPDVEGLLVYRVGEARQYFLIPIDECFKLVGLIRLRWKGLSGGVALWQEVEEFMDRLKQ